VAIDGFAAWFAKDYCDRPLAVDEIIMNEPVVLSPERTVVVYRGTQEVRINSQYTPGESLTVEISEHNGQTVFETIPGSSFKSGGCNGLRYGALYKATWILPAASSPESRHPAIVWAGWAEGHEQVKITPVFVLSPPSLDSFDSFDINADATYRPTRAPVQLNSNLYSKTRRKKSKSVRSKSMPSGGNGIAFGDTFMNNTMPKSVRNLRASGADTGKRDHSNEEKIINHFVELEKGKKSFCRRDTTISFLP
jgi:hypothetical protein